VKALEIGMFTFIEVSKKSRLYIMQKDFSFCDEF